MIFTEDRFGIHSFIRKIEVMLDCIPLRGYPQRDRDMLLKVHKEATELLKELTNESMHSEGEPQKVAVFTALR